MIDRFPSTPRLRAARRASLAGALIAGLALAPGTAQAQSDQSITTRVGLIDPLTITKLSDMDFGDIIGPNAGTIVLTPTATPSCTATGGLVHTAECQPATFGGYGPTNARVRVRRPIGNTITLTGPGADMTVTNITINGDPDLTPVRSNPNWERFRIARADGTFIFRVGGTLNVNANQAPGLYTGTFEIRLDYQ
ncbi:DUF4402 domain-containing protein [Erythrobacter sp. JK5]|uniref:DUF4402 domain-containing protein n=1 Tax=Erythrobacter sp. JK5 TaxID=2829500 RepID=UPI001BADE5AA|nr:DUF4402 domain-containing protein [Erythrobacter sp. JK5]QUL37037.1 DUF4402 domain-containing protein [Erythrobacter sp. JK5]